ncbi:MAG: hypothetical protein Q8P20_07870 [bacterium]|nr:hypothetical protein [bacterium]
MALKDWKKSGNEYFSRNYDRLSLIKYRKTKGYKIILYKGNFGGYSFIPTEDTVFKTKSQAMNFAKAYMRSH